MIIKIKGWPKRLTGKEYLLYFICEPSRPRWPRRLTHRCIYTSMGSHHHTPSTVGDFRFLVSLFGEVVSIRTSMRNKVWITLYVAFITWRRKVLRLFYLLCSIKKEQKIVLSSCYLCLNVFQKSVYLSVYKAWVWLGLCFSFGLWVSPSFWLRVWNLHTLSSSHRVSLACFFFAHLG